MKIIVSFEDRIRPDSTGVYFVRAAQQLGHETFHVYPEDIHKVKPGDADFFLKVDDGLASQVWNPELHPSAYYAIDVHLDTDWRLRFAEHGKFDYVTVAQSCGLDLPWHVNPSYLALGCDPEIHHVGERDKVYDGAFIGNFHTEHAGKRIEAVNEFFNHTPKPYFGNRMFREMTEKYAQSKIVFNQAINKDVGMRPFEAMCSGSCLVSPRLPDMERLGFIDGVHYAAYSGIDEIGPIVKELLSNDDKREGIARNGRRASISHTYAVRLRELLEKIPILQESK
jgi:spore maturation protein CgeB